MKKRIKLVAWVKTKHDGQLIKKTIEPYYNHLIFVAETVRNTTPFGFEIGLCHDLLEDTDTNEAELEKQLITLGYDLLDARFITYCVVELTDVFTKKAYPHLSKSSRKAKEAERLSMISPASQTVKYADLLYNVGWELKYSHKKALKYLIAKKKLLAQMDKGDRKLWKRISKVIGQAIMELKKQ